MMADAFIALENLAAGFADPVHDSQAAFRVLLDTLARPGTIGTIGTIAPVIDTNESNGSQDSNGLNRSDAAHRSHAPIGLNGVGGLDGSNDSADSNGATGATGATGSIAHVPYAAFAALLTLADYETPIWLQRPDDALAAAVRFHTGAPITDTANRAVFAYVHDASTVPAPDMFALGEPETPDRSTTVLIRVDALDGGRSLTLSGPGIEAQTSIAPLGIPDTFWQARAGLAAAFPCGIDCYLVCGARVVGIPRTTLVEMN